MMGMEMMLKNVLGIDPEELKEQAIILKAQADQLVENAQQRLTGLEMRIDQIGKNQVILHAMLAELLTRIPAVESTAPEMTTLAIEDKSDGDGKLN